MIRYMQNASIKSLTVVFIVLILVSAWALRSNNVIMGELRNKVLVADEQDGDIEGALTDLREYIFAHMNTRMEQPVELVNSFNRAVEEARQNAEERDEGNTVYAEAQQQCELAEVPLTVRAQCVQDFIINNAEPGTDPLDLDIPPKELFVYDYESPRWSPDIAGIATLMTSIVGLLIVTKLIMRYVAQKKTI